MTIDKVSEIVKILAQEYPDAKCELNYNNAYELLIAGILSAQATDKAVNGVTTELFLRYPDFATLAKAEHHDVVEIIKKIGLSRTKASYIIATAQIITDTYQGKVPYEYIDLLTLMGVGRKVANIIRIEIYDIPSFPVDTHVSKVLRRLGIADESMSIEQIEYQAYKIFEPSILKPLHHQIIAHGRKVCNKLKPKCDSCKLKDLCEFFLTKN